MTKPLDGTMALVTGASSGNGAAMARKLADLGAAVAAVARRKDRLDQLVGEIENAGGTALSIEADITDRSRAAAAVQQAVELFGRLDIPINNAGLTLLGSVVDADGDEWDRMVQINLLGLLYTTHAPLPHLLAAAEQDPRHVTDLINVSSVAGRQTNPINGVYALTKILEKLFGNTMSEHLLELEDHQ